MLRVLTLHKHPLTTSEERRDVSVLLWEWKSRLPTYLTKKQALRNGLGYHHSFRNEELWLQRWRLGCWMSSGKLVAKSELNAHALGSRTTCLWAKELLKHRRSWPPTQYENEKSNRPKERGCLPSHPARPQGQKAHKVMRHHPLNNTNTHLLKTDLPSSTHRKSTLVSQELKPLSPLRSWWSSIWRGPDTKTHQELQNSGQSAGKLPLLAGERGLHTAGGADLASCLAGPGCWSQHSTAYSPRGKASDPGEETAFV